MKFKSIYRTLLILVILALNVGCDQATKSMMRRHISFYDHYSFFNNHFTLLHVENTGAFLSFGDSLVNPYRFILLSLIPVLALLAALTYIIVKRNFGLLRLTGIIFIIGGGMGNIYDRIAKGSVTDFMHISFGVIQTGVFNVADVSIMTGLAMILIDSMIKRNNTQKIVVSGQ
jgi:signal peptidase II